MAYTTEDKIEKFLGVDISNISTYVIGLIAGVKVWIDNYCGKTFEAASKDRYYDGNGLDRIIVDSFIGNPTVSILEIDGSTLYSLTEGAGSDYLTYPLNSTEKTELVLSPGSQIGAWFKGKRRVKVTANFGFSAAVPSDVEHVATVLVARIIEKSLKGGEPSSIKIGEYQVNLKNINDTAAAFGVLNILDKYREIQI